jgi:protein-tyrosine kinase
MNTIEQAAKRLAELKRAGFDVPVPEMPGAAAAASAPVDAPAAAPVEAPASATAVADVKSAPGKSAASRSSSVVAAARHGVVEALTSSGRRSREVALDLARLEREGYLVPAQARSQLAEQMRIIKRPLLANARGESAQVLNRPNLIQVVSAMPGEGKTFFAINLAMSIAMEVDLSVLLVDADVLRPSVLARCGIEPARGLMDVLQSPSIELHDVMLRTNVAKLSILPAGRMLSLATLVRSITSCSSMLGDCSTSIRPRARPMPSPPNCWPVARWTLCWTSWPRSSRTASSSLMRRR